MIFGIGTDLLDPSRIAGALERHGQRFLERVLSEQERLLFADCHDGARFLAKRWAAKEAFSKALGTGIRPPVTLNGISVVHDALGRPQIETCLEISDFMRERGAGRIHLSLSDEREMILAFVVIECICAA